MEACTPNPRHRVYVAGHRGMVGSAIVRALKARGYENVLTRSRDELDLMDQGAVRAFFEAERPDLVYLAAAKVGGIHANNTYRAQFLYENLVMEANAIGKGHQQPNGDHPARRTGGSRALGVKLLVGGTFFDIRQDVGPPRQVVLPVRPAGAFRVASGFASVPYRNEARTAAIKTMTSDRRVVTHQ